MNRLDLLAVASAQGVPADDGNLLEHLDADFQVAHAGALIMSPAHRHLNHLVTAFEGDKENLRIKAPALDGLELEDGLRGGAGECFESALGIGKAQSHDGAGEGVEAAAEKLAVERLAMSLPAFFQPSRSDGDVRALVDGGKQQFSLLDGDRKSGVGEHDDVAMGLQQAGAHAVALAAV